MSILNRLQGGNVSDPMTGLADAALRTTGHDPDTLDIVGPPVPTQEEVAEEVPTPPAPEEERANVGFMRRVLTTTSPVAALIDPSTRAKKVRIIGGAAKDILVNTTRTGEQLSQWLNNSFQKLTGPKGYRPPENFDTPLADALDNTLKPWIADAQTKGEKIQRELASLMAPGIWATKMANKAIKASKLAQAAPKAAKAAERVTGGVAGAGSDFFVMDPNNPAIAEQLDLMPSWLREEYERFMSTGVPTEELEKNLDAVMKRKVGHMMEGAVIGEVLQTGIQGLSRLWSHFRSSKELISEFDALASARPAIEEQAEALRRAPEGSAVDELEEAAREATGEADVRLADDPDVTLTPTRAEPLTPTQALETPGAEPLIKDVEPEGFKTPDDFDPFETPDDFRLEIPEEGIAGDNAASLLRGGVGEVSEPEIIMAELASQPVSPAPLDIQARIAEVPEVKEGLEIAAQASGKSFDDFLIDLGDSEDISARLEAIPWVSEEGIQKFLRPKTPAQAALEITADVVKDVPPTRVGPAKPGVLPELDEAVRERLGNLAPPERATIGELYPDAPTMIERMNIIANSDAPEDAARLLDDLRKNATIGGKPVSELDPHIRPTVDAIAVEEGFADMVKVMAAINRNPGGPKFLGAGIERVAFDIGDGLVAKLKPGGPEKIPNIPGMVPPVARYGSGNVDLEITRMVPEGVQNELADRAALDVVDRLAKETGVDLSGDLHRGNFRVLEDGSVFIIDQGRAHVATDLGDKVQMATLEGQMATAKRGIEMLGLAGAVGVVGAALGAGEAEAGTAEGIVNAGSVVAPMRRFLGPLVKRGATTAGEITGTVRAAKQSRKRFVQQGKLMFENLENGLDIEAALERLASREGVAASVKNTQTLTDAQLVDISEKLGFNKQGLMSYANNNRPLTRQVFAGMEALKQSDTRMRELAEQVKGGNVEAETQLARQFAMHTEVQRAMLGLSSELGRAMRQLQRDPSGSLKFLADMEGTLQNRKTGTGATVNDLAEMILGTDAAQLNHIAREAMHPTAGGAIVELWKGHRLMSLKTITNNVVGSAFATMWDVPVEFTAGAVNQAFKLGGEQRMADSVTLARGMVGGIVDALTIGGESLRRGPGSSVFGSVRFDHKPLRQVSAEAVNLDPASPIGAMVDWYGKNVVGGVFNVMEATDDFMKTVNFRGGMQLEADRAVRRGDAASVEEFLANPPAEAVEAAMKRGEINTFSRDLFADGTHPFLRDGAKKLSEFGHAHPAMQFFFPFVKTQSNLMMYALDNAPGLSLLQRHAREAIKAGGTEKAEVLGRTMSASFMVSLFGLLAAKGNITGLAPQDPESKALWLADNKENSITLGNGVSIPYAKFEPFSPMLSAAATMAAMTRMEPPANSGFTPEQWQAERMKLALATTMYASKLFTDKTYLRSFKALTDALLLEKAVPGEQRGQGLAEGAAVSAAEILTGFIPSVAQEVDEAIRPERAELLDFVDRIQSRVPFFRPRGERNVLGEKVILGYGFDQNNVSPFLNFGNVLRIAEAKGGELAAEAQKLGLSMRMHSPFISLGGSQLRLTEEEFDDYGKFIGEGTGTPLRKELERLIKTPSYKQSPAFVKEALWKQTFNVRRRIARALLMEKHQAALQQRLQEEMDRKMRALQAQ